jgi:heme exporter protein A
MIEAQGLAKSFGSHAALRSVDLKISKGECVAILGPNGAGKTTLIKVLATLAKASGGKVRLAGFDITKNAVQIRRQIGVVSHQTFLYDNLTAYENMKFYGKMYDVPDLKGRIFEVIEQVGLTTRIHDLVRVFSRGMQQRLSIARAILHDPPILLLDEPETGLDQRSTAMLSELLKKSIEGNRTVLMTTHNLEWCLQLGNRVMVLHQGKITYEESGQNLGLADLRENYNRYTGVTS